MIQSHLIIKIVALLTLSLILVSIISPTYAQTSLWKVSKGGKHLYLAGTIHVLKRDDYPLPSEYLEAYQQSDVLIFEMDIEKVHQPEIAIQLLEAMLYKDGKTIDTELKKETMAALNVYLKKRNLPIEAFMTYRPGGLYFTLMAIELKKMGMVDTGVDEYYFKKAKKDKKKIQALETVEQQVQFMADLALDNKDDLILYGLRDLERLPATMDELKRIWRKGDRSLLLNTLLKPLINDYPEIYQALLVERNKAWLPKIEKLFDTPEIEMVLVGALHMIGKKGLLYQLERKGYTIEAYH